MVGSKYAVERNFAQNLFSQYSPSGDPIFQIDANFGYPAALLVSCLPPRLPTTHPLTLLPERPGPNTRLCLALRRLHHQYPPRAPRAVEERLYTERAAAWRAGRQLLVGTLAWSHVADGQRGREHCPASDARRAWRERACGVQRQAGDEDADRVRWIAVWRWTWMS